MLLAAERNVRMSCEQMTTEAVGLLGLTQKTLTLYCRFVFGSQLFSLRLALGLRLRWRGGPVGLNFALS